MALEGLSEFEPNQKIGDIRESLKRPESPLNDSINSILEGVLQQSDETENDWSDKKIDKLTTIQATVIKYDELPSNKEARHRILRILNIQTLRDDQLKDLLIDSVNTGNIPLIKDLLELNILGDLKMYKLQEPLSFFAIRSKDSELLNALLDRGLDVNERSGLNGDTALHLATLEGNVDCLKILIDHKAELDAKGARERTALHLAAQYQNNEAANLLIDAGAGLNVQDIDLWTPLHFAADAGNPEIAERLILEGAGLEALTKENRTPLHLAAESGKLETAQLLVDKGAALSPEDEEGDTPLHKAALVGNTTLAALLMEHNAPLTILNDDHLSPLQLAIENDNFETAMALDPIGADLLFRFQKAQVNVDPRLGSKLTPEELIMAVAIIEKMENVVIESLKDHDSSRIALEKGPTQYRWVPQPNGKYKEMELRTESTPSIHRRDLSLYHQERLENYANEEEIRNLPIGRAIKKLLKTAGGSELYLIRKYLPIQESGDLRKKIYNYLGKTSSEIKEERYYKKALELKQELQTKKLIL